MYDVVIIGGGVSGCSLLYQLSRYSGRFLLLDKENDVGVGTTKANSAIVHAGYDPEPGTKMAFHNVRGNQIIEQLCQELDILYKKVGSLVVALNTDQEKTIQQLYQRGINNGVPNLSIVRQPQLSQMEPGLSANAICALFSPSAGIVNPWELASAQAEVAIESGAEVQLSTNVSAISKQGDSFLISTNHGEIKSRFVVNAAGVHADKVSAMAGDASFEIRPNRGQYFLLDTSQGKLVSRVIFQCPDKNGKGVLVAPTVHGNLIVGPNAEPATRDDVATTAAGQAFVKESALRSVPNINFADSIRNFAGVRAASTQYDFAIGESEKISGLFSIAGMKSPGLTAAPSAALEIVDLLKQKNILNQKNKDAVSKRKITRFAYLSVQEKDKAIKRNPLYGKIVCRCETVTEGEIVDALHRPLPPHSVDAVKRRCTAGMGRCQGGFCGPRVQQIVAQELGIRQQDIPLDRDGMYIISGETKGKKAVQNEG